MAFSHDRMHSPPVCDTTSVGVLPVRQVRLCADDRAWPAPCVVVRASVVVHAPRSRPRPVPGLAFCAGGTQAQRTPTRAVCLAAADTAVSAHAAPGVTTPAAPIDNASTATAPGVVVQLAATSLTSRTLAASVDIAAPVAVVWGALTDYERLGTFIPNLAENRCLERRPNGAVLYQVGAQEVAMGIRFCAAVTLECVEHEVGVPRAMCTTSRDGLDGPLFPWPSCSLPDRGARDITFALVKGDFKNFKGVWRLQQGAGGADTTHLVYSLFVQPQAWLPVGLIQNRISREVATNLQAVRQHSERLYLAGSAGDGELQRQPQSVQPM